MELNLTSENWWQEIGEAKDLSGKTIADLRGAVSSYLMALKGSSTIPPMIFERDLARIRAEVNALKIDGVTLEIEGEPMEKLKNHRDSFRLRLKEVTGTE